MAVHGRPGPFFVEQSGSLTALDARIGRLPRWRLAHHPARRVQPLRHARQLRDVRASVEQSLLRESRLQEVRKAIDMLPPKQRAAVLMHKYDEKEYSQIAETLTWSESAVKSLLFRAYEALRARLAHFA